MTRTIEIVATGPSALIQDLGRAGNAHLGVAPSGALDQPALRQANRLVGNAEDAAGIEALFGGFRLRARCSCTVAVTGPAVRVTMAGAEHGSHVPAHLGPGQEVAIGTPDTGLRCYLAVSGGIEVSRELGSRSTDVLSGIGPDPLRAGDLLPLGRPRGIPIGHDELAAPRTPLELVIPVLLGPRDDWFADVPAQLAEAVWTVTERSNRVGVRLAGPSLRRTPAQVDAELPSEAIRTGAVQVPPDGLPVVFLADHPTTGGYPVLGLAAAEYLPALGQARPWTTLRFRPIH